MKTISKSCNNCPYNKEETGDNIKKKDDFFCEKINGKTGLDGYCEDAIEDIETNTDIVFISSKEKKRCRRKQDINAKNKKKWKAEHISNYPVTVHNLDICDVNNKKHKKAHAKVVRFNKNQANRATRRFLSNFKDYIIGSNDIAEISENIKFELGKVGSNYKKVYEIN